MATVDDVNAEAQDNKLKALQAMAAGQTDPYNTGQQAIRDSQNAALGQIATSAAAGNAPSGVLDELNPTVSGPGDAAMAAMAGQSDPYANDLAAINATGVASGGSSPSLGSLAGVGKQFPVQRYGPYLRYGGLGSQGEMDDAVLGDARRRVTADSAGYGGAADAAERALVQGATGQVGQALSGGLGGMGATPRSHPEYAALGMGNSMPAHAPVTTSSDLGMGIFRPPMMQSPAELGAAQHPLTAGLAQGFRGSEQAVLNPLELYRYAQQSAIAHGVVPTIAEGHYSPEWGATLALQDLTQPNAIVHAQNEYADRSANGGYTTSELNQNAAAQQALAQAAVKGSPEYQQGALAVQGILQHEAQGTQTPMSVDGLRLILIKQGLPPDVIVQLTKDFGGAFVGGAAANVIDPNGLGQILQSQQQQGP